MNQTDVRQVAQEAAGQTKTFLSKQVDERSSSIGDQLSGTASDVRAIGEELKAKGAAGEGAARLATMGADYLETLGGYLKDADMDRLLADAESFTRKQPWAVAAGALTLGFAASRMLKSSSAQRYRAGYDR